MPNWSLNIILIFGLIWALFAPSISIYHRFFSKPRKCPFCYGGMKIIGFSKIFKIPTYECIDCGSKIHRRKITIPPPSSTRFTDKPFTQNQKRNYNNFLEQEIIKTVIIAILLVIILTILYIIFQHRCLRQHSPGVLFFIPVVEVCEFHYRLLCNKQTSLLGFIHLLLLLQTL